mgnify:CR=1 FL=1|jgi:ABC-type transport system involved in multi-copper enzyme maturation permease subunit
MKHFSIIMIWSVVFALILVSSVAARYISIPPDSIVDNIIKGLEPSKEYVYLIFFGLISFLIASYIRPSRK